MHDDLLILPEGGVHFSRTLRLATLYSETLHVYSPTSDKTLEVMQEFLLEALPSPEDIDDMFEEMLKGDSRFAELNGRDPAQAALVRERFKGHMADHPALDFLRVSIANRDDLALLEREGALTSIFETLHAQYEDRSSGSVPILQGIMEALEGVQPTAASSLLQIPLAIPKQYLAPSKDFPTICSLFDVGLDYGVETLRAQGSISEEQLQLYDKAAGRVAGPATYFLLSACYASQNGCVGVTTDAETQQLFDGMSVALFASEPSLYELMVKRDRIRNALGEAILEDVVPDVSTLPLEEILEIRRKRAPELKSFRVALNALAADIDPQLEGSALSLELDRKIQTVVKPSLHDLKTSINELRTEALRKAFNPTDQIGKAFVGFMVSSGAGLPWQTVAAAGTSIIAKIYNYSLGRYFQKKKLLASNPWTVLFRFQQ